MAAGPPGAPWSPGAGQRRATRASWATRRPRPEGVETQQPRVLGGGLGVTSAASSHAVTQRVRADTVSPGVRHLVQLRDKRPRYITQLPVIESNTTSQGVTIHCATRAPRWPCAALPSYSNHLVLDAVKERGWKVGVEKLGSSLEEVRIFWRQGRHGQVEGHAPAAARGSVVPHVGTHVHLWADKMRRSAPGR